MERHPVYGHNTEDDEWHIIPWRDALYPEYGGKPAGEVSANDDFYKLIQYDEIIDAIDTALDQYDDVDVTGDLYVSDTAHRMTGTLYFDEAEAHVTTDDTVQLGLHVKAGHSGSHGIHYEIGAERQVCSNGMTAFISDLSFSQTHQDPLDYGLAQQAVDAILTSPDEVESRLQAAADQHFINQDEAVLTLLDIGIDRYLPDDDAITLLRDSLAEETSDDEPPSLYDTYNAATRVLTHDADLSQHRRSDALEDAAMLLDQRGELPDAQQLGYDVVSRRAAERSGGDTEEYWPEEDLALHDLLGAHSLSNA